MEQQIKQRYFRKTIENPDGKIVHHGDCDIFNHQICTCGLLHDLISLPHELADEMYPPFEEELGIQEACMLSKTSAAKV